jgi:hypothetical protein
MRTAVILSLLLASALRAQGTISGVVLDPAGHPIRDADVMILGDKARGRSDSTGRFTIQLSTSASSQAALPPSSRERGNLPSRIQSQSVGYVTPTRSSTWRFEIRRVLSLSVIDEIILRGSLVERRTQPKTARRQLIARVAPANFIKIK